VKEPLARRARYPDPRNWGAADFTEEFSEADLEAQRAAFDNFEEINCVIKEEALSTPKDFLMMSRTPEREMRNPVRNQLSPRSRLEREAVKRLARPSPRRLRNLKRSPATKDNLKKVQSLSSNRP
jgi:hypothetical protein